MKELEKYKGSSNIDDKYQKYIEKKENLRSSKTDNYDSERPIRSRNRFEKYTRSSRHQDDNYEPDDGRESTHGTGKFNSGA